MNPRRRTNRGAALVELLAAMAVSSLLLVFFFHADLAVKRSVYSWTVQSSLEETTLLVRQRMLKDLLEIDSVLTRSQQGIDYMNNRGQRVNYDFHNRSIARNGEAILPAEVRLSKVEFSGFARDTEPIGSLTTTASAGFTLRLELSRGDKQRSTVIMPVRPWNDRKLNRSAL